MVRPFASWVVHVNIAVRPISSTAAYLDSAAQREALLCHDRTGDIGRGEEE